MRSANCMERGSMRALKFPERLRRLQAQTGIGEVRMVEGVERLGAKLKSLAFPGQTERLAERHVDVEDRIQTNRGASSSAFRRLILKITGHAGVREDAGDSVLIDVDAARWSGRIHDGQRAEPVIGVVGEIAFHGARQRRAVAPDAGNLPAAHDLIQPAGRAMQEPLALSDRQRVHEIRVEVVPDVEIRGAAERAQVVNILNGRALFSGAGFGRGAVVDGVRPGVVEIELEAVRDSAGGTLPSARGNRLRPRSSTSACVLPCCAKNV